MLQKHQLHMPGMNKCAVVLEWPGDLDQRLHVGGCLRSSSLYVQRPRGCPTECKGATILRSSLIRTQRRAHTPQFPEKQASSSSVCGCVFLHRGRKSYDSYDDRFVIDMLLVHELHLHGGSADDSETFLNALAGSGAEPRAVHL
jgi:hypothetical protein